jgi:DedD protein
MSPGREDSFVIESAIPPRPTVATVEIAKPLPSPPVQRRSPPVEPAAPPPPPPPAKVEAKPAKPVAKPTVASSAPAQPKPALDQDGLPVAWVVQVGSFGNPDNAKRLRKTLQDAGFKVHLKVQHGSSRSLTRVYVGPYVDKSMAERDRKAIAAKLELTPKVIRFQS